VKSIEIFHKVLRMNREKTIILLESYTVKDIIFVMKLFLFKLLYLQCNNFQ